MANFFVKTVTGSMLYQPISQWHSLHFELLIELVAKKLTELWRFKNLSYFLTWWPSSMTYLFVNVTYWNCSPIPYVDQVWWWYVKAFMSYAWQNGQTNRQTDKRTYLQKLKILASNKLHLSRQWNCCSLRCSCSIACRRCSNYIFILDLTLDFNGLGQDKCKMRWETVKCWDSVRLILEVWLYI